MEKDRTVYCDYGWAAYRVSPCYRFGCICYESVRQAEVAATLLEATHNGESGISSSIDIALGHDAVELAQSLSNDLYQLRILLSSDSLYRRSFNVVFHQLRM